MLTLGIVLVEFCRELARTIAGFGEMTTDTVNLAVLRLIHLVLVGNLVFIMTAAGVQALASPDPLDPLVVDQPSGLAQQFGDLAIAVAAILPGQLDDVGRQPRFIVTAPGLSAHPTPAPPAGSFNPLYEFIT